ncbi:Fic family protein [Tsukamurella pseudospumae]|uniref:Cell filamentation protein Fic n=1 Tax=Tsukamurella pseudospumae TaxID=239498 RepID=A0A137ZZ98_9ACTN|nr:Fic family protein [Tsukamurella pseudospumae]KXO89356.1 cell filamentation protein Fic [Tsukamurella pseudospumae]KXP03520.1 cell filamentation protein Fic [Tsukamurella pseudospumae]
MTAITVADLAGVVYSSGKVFDGLSTGRLDTENFLRSGSVEGITSRADLALLEDLRDAAGFILDGAARPTDAALVRDINARITRSGALHPGELRTAEQRIGVRTRYGRHSPEALTNEGLQDLVETLTAGTDPIEAALSLFVGVARAQPFEDGNKRTALFAANHLLLSAAAGKLLTVPVSDTDPAVADTFNDLLARAYLLGEDDGVKNLLRRDGIVPIGA